MSAAQPPLDLPVPRRRGFDRGAFAVSPANAPALRLIEGWRDWPMLQCALSGPAGAGKTHLTHIWMDLTGAERITGAALSDADAPGLVAAGGVAVEDANRIGAAGERALLHLLNLARAERRPVLVTGRAPPARWRIRLPDLASRLAALSHIALGPPDPALMEALLTKQFEDRQLRVAPPVVNFLALRLPRSAAAAATAVTRLDSAGLAAGKRLTVPFVKRALGL